jgi:protein SCO1/2
MVYTSCQTACPLILEDMKKIQKALPDRLRESVRFVAVSFDPKRDTPAKLKEYGQAHGLAGRWTLLRGEAGAVRKLAAALGVQYQQDSRGDFQHSFQISVLNKNGEIAYQQNGIGHDPKAAVAAIEAGK